MNANKCVEKIPGFSCNSCLPAGLLDIEIVLSHHAICLKFFKSSHQITWTHFRHHLPPFNQSFQAATKERHRTTPLCISHPPTLQQTSSVFARWLDDVKPLSQPASIICRPSQRPIAPDQLAHTCIHPLKTNPIAKKKSAEGIADRQNATQAPIDLTLTSPCMQEIKNVKTKVG